MVILLGVNAYLIVEAAALALAEHANLVRISICAVLIMNVPTIAEIVKYVIRLERA